jgi:ribosomal protein S18 acetylase RimI-like enzyme
VITADFPDIDLPGCTVRPLQEADLPALQVLFEQCADYVRLLKGEEVPPTEAEDSFRSGPPGRSLEDKLLYGLFDARGALVAMLDAFARHPDSATWWIGLLILAPAMRGQGIGRKLVESFAEAVASQGGTLIMLGVVEENSAALRFWQALGFKLQSVSEPRHFGQKMQAMYVMQRATIA